MAHKNVDLLNKGYDAFDKGDLDTIRALFTEDVVFHVGGHNQLTGDYRGIDEVFGFFGKIVERGPQPAQFFGFHFAPFTGGEMSMEIE